MADPDTPGRARWLWLLIALVLVAAAIVWLMRPPGQAVTRTLVPSGPFVVKPSAPAVPVTLPNTPMRNVPAPTETPGR